MKKIALSSSDLQKMITESVQRILDEARRPYPTEKYGPYYRKPRWDDETLEHMDYDEGAESEAVEEMVNDVMSELAADKIFKKAKRMMSLGYSRQSLERFFEEDGRSNGYGSGYANALNYYLKPKSKETGMPTYACALEYRNMSPEEQRADVEKYVPEVLKGNFKGIYQTYEKDFADARKYRDEKDAFVAEFMQKYAGNIENMSYVELCEALSELDKNGLHPFDYGKYLGYSGVDKVVEQIEKAKMAKEDDPSVLHFDLGTMNGWGEKENAKYAELKELFTKYHKFNERGWKSARCWSNTAGKLVDDNGELVATYSFDVDSSD